MTDMSQVVAAADKVVKRWPDGWISPSNTSYWELKEAVSALRESLIGVGAFVDASMGYGVFKNFDGNAHDSQFFLHCETKDLAQAAVNLLQGDDGGVAHCDGHEWSAFWDYKLALVWTKDLLRTEDAVKTAVEALKED